MTKKTILKARITIAAALIFSNAGTANSEVPTAEQQERFMAACQQDQKERTCRCAYEGFESVHSKQQMELAIALIAKDEARATEIKSDPSFDYDAYNALGIQGLAISLECLSR